MRALHDTYRNSLDLPPQGGIEITALAHPIHPSLRGGGRALEGWIRNEKLRIRSRIKPLEMVGRRTDEARKGMDTTSLILPFPLPCVNNSPNLPLNGRRPSGKASLAGLALNPFPFIAPSLSYQRRVPGPLYHPKAFLFPHG